VNSIISEYVMNAIKDDARRAGERDRQLLEVRRARITGQQRARRLYPARYLARLLPRRKAARLPQPVA
jgi:hypothetical protein